MRKPVSALLVFLCFNVLLRAQSFQLQTQAGVFVSGDLSLYSRSVTNNPKNCDCSGDHLNDSLKAQDSYRLAKSGGFSYNVAIGKTWLFQTGIWYNDKGFERSIKDLQFGDEIHPGIGRIIDASSTGNPKNVRFIYKFQYVQVPLIFNHLFDYSKRVKDWDYFLSAGVSLDYLIRHNFIAMLEGFSVNGKNKFNVTETGLSPAKFNATLMLGARLEYQWEKNMELCIQPLIRVPLLNVNNDDARYRLFNPGLSLGLNWNIGKFRVPEEKKSRED